MVAIAGYKVRVDYIVYAAPEKVFDALTLEGIIGEWCEGGGSVSQESEGPVKMFGEWVSGNVIAFNKRKLQLSYTWKPAEWDKKTPPSIVEFTFKPHPAGTELIVEHFRFPTIEEADKHEGGWVDYVLDPLNDYFTR